MGHKDVDVLWNLVPLVQQRLASRQVEAPAVEPRRPEHTHVLFRKIEEKKTYDSNPMSVTQKR